LFSKGDKVVYPVYGAGVIEDLKEQEFDGQSSLYYVMRIPIGNLKITVSASKASDLGLREIMDSVTLDGIFSNVGESAKVMSDNWSQRYKDNMEKIKSGDVGEVAGVFASLKAREKQKGLSSAEKKMLSSVKQIILSEIILSYGLEKPAAELVLDRITL
jgi:CarD family transcriptional regulator